MDRRRARIAGRYAWQRLSAGSDRFPARDLRRQLRDVLPGDVLDDWLSTAGDDAGKIEAAEAAHVERAFSSEARSRWGIYMTPDDIADGLAAATGPKPGDRVLDLAAGTGALLAAVARHEPDAELFGVEHHPALAVVAAVRLLATTGDAGRVQVWVGDGLSSDVPWSPLEGSAEIVVGNPPYVREKGEKRRFRRLRSRHEHLDPYFGPRIDLAYLFVHRSLDFAATGGRLAFLTTAYWLSATGASELRRDLTERAEPLAFLRTPGTSWFESAPGHHSLISVFERRRDPDAAEATAASLSRPPDDWGGLLASLVEGAPGRRQLRDGDRISEPPEEAFDGSWSPFTSSTVHDWGERLRERGTKLGRLVADHQGFVSGADRVTSRRLGQLEESPDDLDPGDPGFLFEADEVDERLEELRGTVLRPLLRARRLERNDVWVAPPATDYALYLDGELGAGQGWVVDHLESLRPALEQRREVRDGRMPWYRMHWPRDRADQTAPKLVVPRRAPEPRFALDLSASTVSSDCTYLRPSDSVDAPLRFLATLMVALNRAAVGRYLRHFGKRKGEMLEFYSEPLRELPVPLRQKEGELRWIPELLAGDTLRVLRTRVSSILRDTGVRSAEGHSVGGP